MPIRPSVRPAALHAAKPWRRIIGRALLVLGALGLAACSSVRLGYDNASTLTWWWLDRYVSFPREQAPAARAAVDRFFEWHRGTQLATYLPLLQRAQAQLPEPTTAAAVCRWQDDVQNALEPSYERALQLAAEVVPQFTEAQFRSMEQRYAKSIADAREQYLQPDLAERREKGFERAVQRFERVYGSLGEAQRLVLRRQLEAAPWNPELWIAERQRRQADVLRTLRAIAADKPPPERRLAALRELRARLETSGDPAYRAHQQRVQAFNCEVGAAVHNSTTAAQRQAARARFKGWEDDLRALAAPAS